MRWKPNPIWKDTDAIIIGGGRSLIGFDWSQLRDVHTVGCNSAFRLGVDVCEVCCFGDQKFYNTYASEMGNYEGEWVTNTPGLLPSKCEWLHTMPRLDYGLGHEELAWNNSTGALAVNVALLLGAKRIGLLGMDMKSNCSYSQNWHEFGLDNGQRGLYEKFTTGFTRLSAALSEEFPDREIVNCGPDSALDVFPRMSLDQFLGDTP